MRRISAVVAVALALPALAAGATKDVKLALVAYSTPKDAYAKIIPAFQKTAAGKGVSFSQSYGASGEQARAVVQGLPADVVELSLAPDIATLVQAHLVSSSWDKNQYHGIVTRSVVVFVVRSGNPKHIRTWSDLLESGVQVVTPKVTILIENPIAVTSSTKHAKEAKAFVKFLYTAQAQSLFAETGYRPILKSMQKKFRFTNPKQLFTIGYVGGWTKVQKTFFDPNSSVMATIERSLGG